jgi:hypothetical protein
MAGALNSATGGTNDGIAAYAALEGTPALF